MKPCDTCRHDPCRCETIRKLLDLLPDSEETMERGVGAGEGRPPLMPSMYHHPSFVELRATIIRLLDCDRAAWAHLLAFYKSEWRTVTRHVKHRNPHGKMVSEPRIVRERVVSPWIREDLKDRGVKFVCREFRGEPFLPDEVTLTAEELAEKRARRKSEAA